MSRHELPVSHNPPSPRPTSPQPPPHARARRLALLCRVANAAFLFFDSLHSSPITLRIRSVTWTSSPPENAILHPAAAREACTAVRAPLGIAALAALVAALFEERAASRCRQVAGILAACVASACNDAAVITLSCAAVAMARTRHAAVAWAVAWWCQLGPMIGGAAAGGDRAPLMHASIAAVALAVESGVEPSWMRKLVTEVAAEVCVVTLLVRMSNTAFPAPVCVS